MWQIVPDLPLTEGEGDRLKQGAVLVGSSRHDGVYGRYVRPLVMLLESSRVAAAWKDTCEGCKAAALQKQVRELQQLLQRERAAASREKEATALIAKQQEIALRETEGSKQTLLVGYKSLWAQLVPTSSPLSPLCFQLHSHLAAIPCSHSHSPPPLSIDPHPEQLQQKRCLPLLLQIRL